MPSAAGRMPRLALVGLSVRALAQAAQAEGLPVLALDAFGDADTRQASAGWWPIGSADGHLRLDGPALLAALAEAAARGAEGWIATAGLEDRPALQARAEALLPLWGMPASRQRLLRNPWRWMPLLDAAGVPRPPTARAVPADAASDADPAGPAGRWLLKHWRGSGGSHVQWARPGQQADGPHRIAQRWLPGQPMSATFVADGRVARLLGFNRLRVPGVGSRPFTFCGAVGPVPVPAPVRAVAESALAVLVPAFGVVGLGSLDLVVDGEQATVLELNARPPATLALYPHAAPVVAHLAGCAVHGRPVPAGAFDHRPDPPVAPAGLRGFEVIWSPRAGRVSAALADALSQLPGVHDRPHAGDPLAVGAPLCTVAAQADGPGALDNALAALAGRVRSLLAQHLPPIQHPPPRPPAAAVPIPQPEALPP